MKRKKSKKNAAKKTITFCADSVFEEKEVCISLQASQGKIAYIKSDYLVINVTL